MGLATLSSKLDNMASPIVTARSLPTTCAHTIMDASHCVGFTFPGMILLPGSFSGSSSSPNPARGPEPSIRMSLTILAKESAMTLSTAARDVCASCAARLSNLLGALTNGRPVSLAISLATIVANSGGALRPVPTAVPPMAICSTCGSAPFARVSELCICCAYPENSCPSVMGTASMRCVRPILTRVDQSADFSFSASLNLRNAGMRLTQISYPVAMLIAVGKVSFDDCDILTWSFACTGFFEPNGKPSFWLERFASTSFMFMLVCVPEPVCHTTSGK
mmetsp:Transcript_8405/g.14463  ORF Transcript_8405/g.14463 Transcript_8405/m.14463 type:complete len:278 (+) Transcript_8405:234-1067(+)